MASDRSTILHLSDLHFGPPLVPGAPDELRREIERHHADLVVVTGDLTQRAKPRQFRAAATFLRSLGVPILAIPGNHDIPLYPVHRRIFTPYRQFRLRISGQRESTILSGSAVVVGIDTTAPYFAVEGHAYLGRTNRWQERFEALPSDRFKIAAMHHPLLGPPNEGTRHLLRGGRELAARLAGAGCRLALSGHLHVSFLRHAGDVWPDAKGLWLLGSGTSSSNRGRGADRTARSYSVVRTSPGELAVERWRSEAPGSTFERVESRMLVTREPITVAGAA